MSDFARFDRRGYAIIPVEQGYKDWQPTYEDTVEDLMDVALLERVDSVPWQQMDRAADLGCGTGRTGAWLLSRGVGEVDGVDLTPEMLAAARGKGIYQRLSRADVRTSGLAGRSYPLVVCCLVDEHLPELAPLYLEASRLLRPSGWFVLVGYHPFFIMATGMPTHFDHPDGYPVAIDTYVHLASDHVEAGREAGLSLIEMHEGRIDDAWLEVKPKWQDRRDLPISFCMVWGQAS